MKILFILLLLIVISIITDIPVVNAGNTGNPGSVHVAKYSNNCKGAISLTFDDGFKREVEDALKIIDVQGVKGTFFINPGNIDNPRKGKMQWNDLKKKVLGKGHEIGNHSSTHPKLHTCDDAALEKEVNGAHAKIKEKLGIEVYTFCYPGGTQRSEKLKKKILEKHHDFRGKVQGYGNVGKRVFTVEKGNKWVDDTISKGEWLVAMMHAIKGGYSPFTKPKDFEDHVKYIVSKKNEIWCAPFASVSKYKKEFAAATLKAKKSGRKVTFVLTCTLDPKVFNQPLTVVIPAKGAKKAKAKRKGERKPIEVTVRDGNILVDIVPGKNPVEVKW